MKRLIAPLAAAILLLGSSRADAATKSTHRSSTAPTFDLDYRELYDLSYAARCRYLAMQTAAALEAGSPGIPVYFACTESLWHRADQAANSMHYQHVYGGAA